MAPGPGIDSWNLAVRILFALMGGSLRLEDTVVENPAARLLGAAAGVWSNTQHTGVVGVSLGLLVWTEGHVRIPRGYRVWHKGGPSKVPSLWRGGAPPAPDSGASPSACGLMRGIPPSACCNGARIPAGSLCASARKIAPWKGWPCPRTARIPTGMRSGTCPVGSKSLWCDTVASPT